MTSEGAKSIPASCPHCDKVVALSVQTQFTAYHDQWEGPPERWTVCQCPGCQQPVMYLEEYYGHVGDGPDDGWDGRYQMYPAHARKMSAAVPKPLREDHDEARRCLQAKCYRAAVIMCRRIVEGICVDNGYTQKKDGDLFKRLGKMRDDGVIDARLYEWADASRQLGNEGAHATTTPIPREDAEEILKFVEAMLDYLYVFRAQFDAFKERRAEVAAAAKAAATAPAKAPAPAKGGS